MGDYFTLLAFIAASGLWGLITSQVFWTGFGLGVVFMVIGDVWVVRAWYVSQVRDLHARYSETLLALLASSRHVEETNEHAGEGGGAC